MANKTGGVFLLAQEVLQTIPTPYGEDIIEDVFLRIEVNPIWLRGYEQLVRELTKDVTNQWIGRYVKDITGLETIEEVPAIRSHLTGNYSKLRP